MKSNILKTLGVIAVISPGVAFAAQANSLSDVLTTINGFVQPLITFAIALAVLFFLYGLLQYVTAGDDPEKQKNGRSKMIYGVVVIFVMVSVWGLVNLLSGTFSTKNTQQPAPVVPTLGQLPS